MALPLLPVAAFCLPVTQKGLQSCKGGHVPPSRSEGGPGSRSCTVCAPEVHTPELCFSPPVPHLSASQLSLNWALPRAPCRLHLHGKQRTMRDSRQRLALGHCSAFARAQATSFWPWACGHVLPHMGGLGRRASEQRWDQFFSIPGFLPEAATAGIPGTRGWPGAWGRTAGGLAAQLSRGWLGLSFRGFRFASPQARGRRLRFPAPPSCPSFGVGSDGPWP